jgi:hypothetical protein
MIKIMIMSLKFSMIIFIQWWGSLSMQAYTDHFSGHDHVIHQRNFTGQQIKVVSELPNHVTGVLRSYWLAEKQESWLLGTERTRHMYFESCETPVGFCRMSHFSSIYLLLQDDNSQCQQYPLKSHFPDIHYLESFQSPGKIYESNYSIKIYCSTKI